MAFYKGSYSSSEVLFFHKYLDFLIQTFLEKRNADLKQSLDFRDATLVD